VNENPILGTYIVTTLVISLVHAGILHNMQCVAKLQLAQEYVLG